MTHLKTWTTVLFSAVLLMASPLASAGVLLYYDFEDDAGATIDNKGSLATSGTLTGADVTAAGPAGGFTPTTSRTFSGSYVDTGLSAVALTVHQQTNYTMSAWLRPLDNSGDHMVFGQDPTPFLHNGTRNNSYHQGHYGNDITGGNISSIPLGDWRHVTWVYRDGVEQIYVNGVSTVGPSAKGWVNNAANVLIGRAGGGRNFQGDLDDVVIYEEALTPYQIQHLAGGGDPFDLPEFVEWNFGTLNLQDWNVVYGTPHLRTGDGGGLTPGDAGGGFAHDGAHDTFLAESPGFHFDGTTLDGTNVLSVTFAGGAGDQNGLGVIFSDQFDVIAYNDGVSNSTGQKGLAFLNMGTGLYDATIFENDNGGTNTRLFSLADLVGLGLDPTADYRLHFFENDQGSWGWGQLNAVVLAGTLTPEPTTLTLVGLGIAALARKRRKA